MKATGLQQPKAYKYLDGQTKNPRIDFVDAVCTAYPNLNANWWVSGKGTMMLAEELTSVEVRLIQQQAAVEGRVEKLKWVVRELKGRWRWMRR